MTVTADPLHIAGRFLDARISPECASYVVGVLRGDAKAVSVINSRTGRCMIWDSDMPLSAAMREALKPVAKLRRSK